MSPAPRSPPEKQRDRATKASQDPQAHGRPWCLSERREALRLPKEISYMEVSMNGVTPKSSILIGCSLNHKLSSW